VEELIAAAVANARGDELASQYDGDDYDATISGHGSMNWL
jgi:hypothetical protein